MKCCIKARGALDRGGLKANSKYLCFRIYFKAYNIPSFRNAKAPSMAISANALSYASITYRVVYDYTPWTELHFKTYVRKYICTHRYECFCHRRVRVCTHNTGRDGEVCAFGLGSGINVLLHLRCRSLLRYTCLLRRLRRLPRL